MRMRIALLLLFLAPAFPSAAGESRLTSLARLLAGKVPEDSALLARTSTDAWKTHAAFFKENWTRTKNRFDKAAAWRDRELALPSSSTGTLMYPFSGPDFLNASLFFPEADLSIFYSLEPAGVLPDVAAMTDDEFAALLSEIRDALGDIFKRHYFITKNMNEELRTPYLKGTKTLLLVFMSLMDKDVVSVEDMALSPDGDPVPLSAPGAGAGAVKGVKVVFRSSGRDRDQTLLYFSLDVSDKKLARRPEFAAFLRKNAPAATFIKSASYLLHDDQFSSIRALILETTGLLMQDDSGLPLRFLPAADWTVRLYGRYTEPIKDFNYGHQEDMAAAYDVPGAARPLPFKFGYHWWDGYSNVQVARRKSHEPLPLP